MKYETYYSDGGSGGPHENLDQAAEYAIAYVHGFSVHGPQYVTVEIRPRNSKAVGGFNQNNPGSYFVTKSGDRPLLFSKKL